MAPLRVILKDPGKFLRDGREDSDLVKLLTLLTKWIQELGGAEQLGQTFPSPNIDHATGRDAR